MATELSELSSEYGIITVTDVYITADLSYLDISVSALRNPDTLTKVLSDHAHTIHRLLGKKIEFIKVPRVRFRYDSSGEDSFEVYKTIKNLDIT